MKPSTTNDASLLSPSNYGGVIGGKGYNYQDAFIVSRIPEWLAKPSFVCLLKEGIEDVDVMFQDNSGTERYAIQVKDHVVKDSEFRDVITNFYQKDHNAPGTYSQFVLACRGLSDGAKSIRLAIERLRGAHPLHVSDGQVIQATRDDLQKRIENLGLSLDIKFLEDKVLLDTDLGDMTTDERLCQQFVGGIHQYFHERASTPWVALAAVYRDLAHLTNRSVGKTCTRDQILERIESTISSTPPRLDKEGTLVRLYHWEDPSFDLSEEWDILLDWSKHFKRSTRQVPAPAIWQELLLPELQETQKHIRATSRSRLIRFRPSACLSAGFALGWAFSEVKGYRFEVQQGPTFWSTDTHLAEDSRWAIAKEIEIEPSSTRLCIELSQQADVARSVDLFQKTSGISWRSRLSLVPNPGLGVRLDAGAALAYADEAKKMLRQYIDKYQCTIVDLFYAGPLGLAIFLGRLFNALHASIQCYEQQDDGKGYTASCLLRT